MVSRVGKSASKTRPASGTALAVTGSKGGVGKSTLVVNLAVALARMGRQVLLVDGDLGLANLDVLLGLTPRRTIDHLMRGEASVADVLMNGPEGIRVLPAASGIPRLANLDAVSRMRLLAVLGEACALVDDMLVDTGAGLGETTLALQLAAARIILVTTPEPPSLVDAYATLKVLWAADPAKRVDLVVNAAEHEQEATRVYEQIARAAQQFLGRKPGWLGAVYHDPRVAEAVRRQSCLLQLYPDSRASRCYERLALKLTVNSIAGKPTAEYWMRLAREELLH